MRERLEDWAPGKTYEVGDQRRWNGARLVCTEAHAAGGRRKHPWDADADAERAATLWTPATAEDRTRVLRAVGNVTAGRTGVATKRLTDTVLLACGVQ